MREPTTDDAIAPCPTCGFARASSLCAVCRGEGVALGRRSDLAIGPGNPLADALRGLDDVRRAVLALLFEAEFVGALRGPILVNMAAMTAFTVAGWRWLLPALEAHFASRGEPGAHLWVLAVWLGGGPSLLDLCAGWAMGPIRRAAERHMLGATPTAPPASGPRLLERVQLLMLGAAAVVLMLGAALVPWVGPLFCLALGAGVAAVVYMQPPLAVRGLAPRARLDALRRQPWRALGAGLGLQLAAAVPFLNVLALLPVATVTATSTYLHMDKRPRASTRA